MKYYDIEIGEVLGTIVPENHLHNALRDEYGIREPAGLVKTLMQLRTGTAISSMFDTGGIDKKSGTIRALGNVASYPELAHVKKINNLFFVGVDSETKSAEMRERFLEEAVELFESMGGSLSEAQALTTHVYEDKPHVGSPLQEFSGVLSTLMSIGAILNTSVFDGIGDAYQRLLTNVEKTVRKDSLKKRFYTQGK